MEKQFAVASLRKNGLLGYKNNKTKELVIYNEIQQSNAETRNLILKFSNRLLAEAFIKENGLASVEIVETKI